MSKHADQWIAVDKAFALFLLVTGHLALVSRLGLSWFDLFYLDAWLVPVASWYMCNSSNQKDNTEHVERYRDPISETVGVVGPPVGTNDATRNVKGKAGDSHEFD